MVLSIRERIKGFLFNPSETFDNSKEDTIGDAFKYYIVILAISGVLVVIIGVVLLLIERLLPFLPPGVLSVLFPLYSRYTVGDFIIAPLVGIIGVFIVGLWIHIWVYFLGGRNGVGQTIKVGMYAVDSGLSIWIYSNRGLVLRDMDAYRWNCRCKTAS